MNVHDWKTKPKNPARGTEGDATRATTTFLLSVRVGFGRQCAADGRRTTTSEMLRRCASETVRRVVKVRKRRRVEGDATDARETNRFGSNVDGLESG